MNYNDDETPPPLMGAIPRKKRPMEPPATTAATAPSMDAPIPRRSLPLAVAAASSASSSSVALSEATSTDTWLKRCKSLFH